MPAGNEPSDPKVSRRLRITFTSDPWGWTDRLCNYFTNGSELFLSHLMFHRMSLLGKTSQTLFHQVNETHVHSSGLTRRKGLYFSTELRGAPVDDDLADSLNSGGVNR